MLSHFATSGDKIGWYKLCNFYSIAKLQCEPEDLPSVTALNYSALKYTNKIPFLMQCPGRWQRIAQMTLKLRKAQIPERQPALESKDL